MVIEAIREARAEIVAFFRSESQRSYPDPALITEGLTALLKEFDHVERILNFKNQELPPKHDRFDVFPSALDFYPSEELSQHPSVKDALGKVMEGWYLVRDGPD
jgi:hypothetical protein